ncbi:hypothetical protein PPERSA_05315 [Pseudocohnilembus persalinus]|uniref:Uncharacterized protein n=1 Tax=Pseudocohnilembus persalinus TaxID=266149 RepID=A0A0V0R622_PSEPJ|nr:hypothetical protein PPERSA_05315 [Pseudocohnilembus persalinus]|eukprot:KRX09923.1 hypothetical protein PPERSA_05315 [Pseudocohnilembus persalinus]
MLIISQIIQYIEKIYDDQDEIEEIKNKSFESSLYKFNSPASLIDWIYDTDIQIGGGSEAVLYHDLKNQMGKKENFEVSEIEDLRLDNIAIALETEEAGEFKFEMQEIKLVYNPDFEELQKQYKRPFFFYQQSSYKNCKLINTGQDLLYMRESVEQTEEIQQEQKEKQFYEQQKNGEQKMGHTINNLYDQKKGKKISSFGEFLKKKN